VVVNTVEPGVVLLHCAQRDFSFILVLNVRKVKIQANGPSLDRFCLQRDLQSALRTCKDLFCLWQSPCFEL
jgi:hypothetical protein